MPVVDCHLTLVGKHRWPRAAAVLPNLTRKLGLRSMMGPILHCLFSAACAPWNTRRNGQGSCSSNGWTSCRTLSIFVVEAQCFRPTLPTRTFFYVPSRFVSSLPGEHMTEGEYLTTLLGLGGTGWQRGDWEWEIPGTFCASICRTRLPLTTLPTTLSAKRNGEDAKKKRMARKRTAFKCLRSVPIHADPFSGVYSDFIFVWIHPSQVSPTSRTKRNLIF